MDDIDFHGYPPTFKPQFIRHVHQKKMYLVEHEGNQYILAHYNLTDCDCTEPNGPYKMGASHEEFEVTARMASSSSLSIFYPNSVEPLY